MNMMQAFNFPLINQHYCHMYSGHIGQILGNLLSEPFKIPSVHRCSSTASAVVVGGVRSGGQPVARVKLRG